MGTHTHISLNMKAKIKKLLIKIGLYTWLIFMSLVVLIPIVWIIGSSFNESSSLTHASMIPTNPTLRHYKELFTETNYLRWYWNTFKIASMNVVVTVILSTTTGYIFGRLNFKGKKASLLTILVMQMFPSFLGMTALYVLFLTFGLLDSHWALILLYGAGSIPGNTWLLKGYLNSIPKELDESAMLDGASKTQVFLKIILPLIRPMVTFFAIGAFMGPWMDFIFPRLILSSNENLTLAVGLHGMITGNANNYYTRFAAGAVLVAIPMTVMFIAVQKHMVEGLSAGATKG